MVLNFKVKEVVKLKTYNIDGFIKTKADIPVKYAAIVFKEVSDTNKIFSGFTDSTGHYNLSLTDKVDSISFKVQINTADSARPKINKIEFENVIIYGDTTIDFIVNEVEVISVILQGKISTVSSAVKYAQIQFINDKDSTRIFSTMTDTTGNYHIEISSYVDEMLFTAAIINNESTFPKIYDEVFENITLQRDTVINFTVEEVGQWVKVKRNILSWLQDIDFADSLNGWTVGRRYYDSDDEILHTTDGGDTWTRQVSPVDEDFQGVDFIDSQKGWICSWHSILKTTDGGNNWEVVFHEDFGDTGYLRDIEFLNDSIGFALGGKGLFASIGVLLKTTNAGETWTDIAQPGWTTLTKISIVDEQNIWICGFGGTIINTSDLGLSWTKKTIGSLIYTRFLAIQFVNKFYGWIGSDDEESEFYRTTDGGVTWQSGPFALYLSLGIKAFFFVDSLNGWLAPVLGFGSWSIINTKDGGKTWDFLPKDTNFDNIRAFCFINNIGWAVGSEPINKLPRSVILRYKMN